MIWTDILFMAMFSLLFIESVLDAVMDDIRTRRRRKTPRPGDIYIRPDKKLPWTEPETVRIKDVKDGWVLLEIKRYRSELYGYSFIADVSEGHHFFNQTAMPVRKFLRQGWILKTTENEKKLKQLIEEKWTLWMAVMWIAISVNYLIRMFTATTVCGMMDEAQVYVLCLLISTLFFMLYLDEAKIRMLERDKEETYKKNIK